MHGQIADGKCDVYHKCSVVGAVLIQMQVINGRETNRNGKGYSQGCTFYRRSGEIFIFILRRRRKLYSSPLALKWMENEYYIEEK